MKSPQSRGSGGRGGAPRVGSSPLAKYGSPMGWRMPLCEIGTPSC